MKIAASILSANFAKLGEELLKASRSGSDIIHIDIMDGHFVPNITIGPSVVADLRKLSDIFFDVHLMIDNPEQYIEHFAFAGADNITVHFEATKHLDALINKIKSYNKKASVAINPATSICSIENILSQVDMILVMTVNPGFGGQQFIPYTLDKIKELNKVRKIKGYSFKIEVDGGINLDNINQVVKAGADIIVTGSTLFNSDDMKNTIEKLRQNASKIIY
ncbi:ribulose-phosphate 3-epimerase [Caldicellulosiruptoraceae bacterium PP1]